jgi:hemerythrin-like metal-binding protein
MDLTSHNKNMIIDWNDGFSVGIKIIDEQHRDLVETVNKLYDSIYKNSASEEIDDAFKHLMDYAEHHFGTEERFFEEFGYEGKKDHVAEHDKFREELERLKAQIGKMSNEKLAVEVLTVLEGWLEIHVKDMDQKYVACFKEHGLQ